MTENERTRKTISAAIQSGDANKLQKALRTWLRPVERKVYSESLKEPGHEARNGE